MRTQLHPHMHPPLPQATNKQKGGFVLTVLMCGLLGRCYLVQSLCNAKVRLCCLVRPTRNPAVYICRTMLSNATLLQPSCLHTCRDVVKKAASQALSGSTPSLTQAHMMLLMD